MSEQKQTKGQETATSVNDNEHCEAAKRIIARQGDTIVIRKGEPTDLYYHILDCAACEYLRELQGHNTF